MRVSLTRDSKKGMIGTLGIPRDSKKGMIGTLGIPRDSKKGMIEALGIPRDSKRESRLKLITIKVSLGKRVCKFKLIGIPVDS